MEITRARWKKWLVRLALAGGLVAAALTIAGYYLSARFEPFIQTKTVQYLENKLNSEVELSSLKVSLPLHSPFEILLRRGKGVIVRVRGQRMTIRFEGRRDIPPLMSMGRFQFDLDLHTLWNSPVHVPLVRLEGLELHMPPKGERPKFSLSTPGNGPTAVVIDRIVADGSRLVILPKDPLKRPLDFVMYKLTLRTVAPGSPMLYDTSMTNAKPPGIINASGNFGPWVGRAPSTTPVDGIYRFENADLGVFKGIDGTLTSTGKFKGLLERITVDGETRTPEFRLKSGGSSVPLTTSFHCIVDGTNGNTLLQPVRARLGRTAFLIQGAVERRVESQGRTVALDVNMVEGKVEDLLRLAMKSGEPLLEGGIDLKMVFELPPGKGQIADRLRILGRFALKDASFTRPTIQQKIDEFSRKGQGRPNNTEISQVPTNMAGRFRLASGKIDFSQLSFLVPGARVDLKGDYGFASQEVAFRGTLRLDARVSQTQTGWKRWVLKPVDFVFAKEGAGTFLRIKVSGTPDQPSFGLDR